MTNGFKEKEKVYYMFYYHKQGYTNGIKLNLHYTLF